MAENPYTYASNQNDKDYKFQAVFRLKKLKYLDYILIDESLRQEAEENCKDQYQEINDQKEAKADDDKNTDKELIEAHIDCTDRMLDKIHALDPDGQKLRILPKFEEFWTAFDGEVIDEV